MNIMTVGLGLAMVAYGVTTIVLRATRPHLFRKLEPMKQFWGARTGLVIHVVGYSVVPIVAGLIFTISGARGGSIF
jgi:hypothetical protein